MKQLIVYGSEYGSSKAYALELAKITGIPCIDCDSVKELMQYEQIVYFGGLYAGGIKGLKTIVKQLSPDMRVILVTVGLADVYNEENINNIRASLRKQVPKQILDRAIIFHLRGGIDYQRLSFKHKMMMKILYHSLKNKPLDTLTQEDRDLIETYNKKVDFVDFDSLKQIIAEIR